MDGDTESERTENVELEMASLESRKCRSDVLYRLVLAT